MILMGAPTTKPIYFPDSRFRSGSESTVLLLGTSGDIAKPANRLTFAILLTAFGTRRHSCQHLFSFPTLSWLTCTAHTAERKRYSSRSERANNGIHGRHRSCWRILWQTFRRAIPPNHSSKDRTRGHSAASPARHTPRNLVDLSLTNSLLPQRPHVHFRIHLNGSQ